MFSHNIIPAMNKISRVTENTAITINHITKTVARVVDTQSKGWIIWTDLLDHFHIIFSLQTSNYFVEKNIELIAYKRCYDKKIKKAKIARTNIRCY